MSSAVDDLLAALLDSVALPGVLLGRAVAVMLHSRTHQHHIQHPVSATLITDDVDGGYNYDSTSIRRPFDERSTAHQRSLRSH